MATKPYKNNDDHPTQHVSEPVAAYIKEENISLNGLGVTTDVLNSLVARAESDFANGRYTTSADLYERIKRQRGW